MMNDRNQDANQKMFHMEITDKDRLCRIYVDENGFLKALCGEDPSDIESQ